MTTPDTLTELKSAVEGMKRHVSDVDNGHNIGFNAACDQFQHLIDEMIRRG